jgi:hypothetical protein
VGFSALRSIPNLEDQVSVFMSLSERIDQFYPQALGFTFVAYYDSQGYGGGILTRPHAGQLFILCRKKEQNILLLLLLLLLFSVG